MNLFLLSLAALYATANASPKIVGGGDAPADRFPYFVGLYVDACTFEGRTGEIPEAKRAIMEKISKAAEEAKQFGCPQFVNFCGASAIDQDGVLSAGHCLLKKFIDGIDGPTHFIVADTDGSGTGSLQEIALNIRHPNYNSFTLNNDYMVVRPKNPLPANTPFIGFSPFIDSSEPITPTTFTIVGLGLLEQDYENDGVDALLPDVLQTAEVQLVSDEECNAAYGGGINPAVMICAADDGIDSCQGDSGGPLVLAGDLGDGTDDLQVGVVSFGRGCAAPDFPGVYSRVSAVTAFIQDALEQELDEDEGGDSKK